MDNIRFGSFVAQLRKERGLTQKELAQRLHVTDKAVSKWETGRGFPDLKLLEPLAQTLLALLCAACGVLVFRLHCLERRLK